MTRAHARPPQGTSRIEGASTQRRIHAEAMRLLRQIEARVADPELDALVTALARRDSGVAALLIPILKKRYGADLFALVKGKAR